MTSSIRLIPGNARTITAITQDDVCLVQEFIEGYPDGRERKKILRQIRDTAENGPHPSRERFRVIGQGMFEIKCYQIRILGFFQPNRVMLLTHGCVKKKDELDEQEILRAKKLFREYQEGLGSNAGE